LCSPAGPRYKKKVLATDRGGKPMATGKKKGRRTIRKPVRKTAKRPAKTTARRSARKAPARRAVTRQPAPRKAATRKPAAARAAKKAFAVGRFCWHDLMAQEPKEALGFYQPLLHWAMRTVDMGPAGPYHILRAEAAEFGGIAQSRRPEAAPHWLPYVGVADIEATCAAAERAGGAVVVPPTPCPGIGRFAVLADPTGATLAALQLAGPPRRDLDRDSFPGLVAWNELVTPDPAAAGPFYARVFGWKLTRMPMPDGSAYELFERSGAPEAGMMKLPPDVAGGHALWLSYFHVADVDATAKQAQELQAKLLLPAWTIAGVGRMVVLADPAGAIFAAFKPEKE
jgi:predicted enzyme related to lactoylglutathione lyase